MKRVLLTIVCMGAGCALFAQNAQSQNQNEVVEEEIELPDVTTVVNGKTFTAGKDSVPDYTKILPENSAPEIQLPELEGVKTTKELPELRERSAQTEKDIYAEGELGAGYPFYFKGDFSIYRASGNSPFEIDFSHESSEGFAEKKASEGFFVRNTAVRGEKSLFTTHGTHVIEGEYKTSDDGLQLNSDSYSDMVKHTISAKAGSDWHLDNGILISYGADGAWFNRYGEIMKESVKSGDFIDSTKILDINPFFGFGWQGSGFKAMFTALYSLQANLEENDNLYKADGSSSAEGTHRGQFSLGLSWKNDFIALGADGSLIVGTATGSKDVVPAFALSVDFKTESFTDGRYITISTKGGLDSYQEKIRNLENKFRFAAIPCLPTETTDWFTDVELSVPILTAFEAKAGVAFRKTAFENGVWTVKYADDYFYPILDPDGATVHSSGLYQIESEERTEFNTNLGFYADFASLKASAVWASYWKSVPALTDEQNITLKLEYQTLDAKWNAGTSTAFAFGGDADTCPNISGWAGIRLASALRVAFELNDVIKLFGRESREYAHSKYITTSGNAVLLVKFQF